MSLARIKAELRKLGTPQKAKASAWFFKTGPGHYGEGDKFLGLTVPEQRAVAKKYSSLDYKSLKTLLNSPYHEERLVSLLILVERFKKGDAKERGNIYRFYFNNSKQVNNWDLVDLSADKIVGSFLLHKPRGILYKLAKSTNLWQKRIAIVATFAFIRAGQFTDTFKISEILLNDRHDLIHKAAGWMLREAGKRNRPALEKFLRAHYKQMPRTMLRYAIEKFPGARRQYYMAK